MKKLLKDTFKEIDKFFGAPPTTNQKAWGIVHDFLHLILTQMDNMGMTQSDLARELKVSRSAISQLLNNTPNMTIKRMVEIADATSIDINFNIETAAFETQDYEMEEAQVIEVE